MFDADIAILKQALHTKLWRPVSEQGMKWVRLLKELCELHQVPVPDLVVDPSISIPQYGFGTIYLDKLSVLSFLHEFAHHIGYGEFECWKYSESVFRGAYPKGFARLHRDEKGFLVK